MCNHDVGRLQIAMNHLFVVHVFQRIHQLSCYLAGEFCREGILLDELLQIIAVNIFHHHYRAQVVNLFQIDGTADIGMFQLLTYFKLLGECLAVNRGVEKIVLETFQHETLAVFGGCKDACMARNRHVALVEIAECILHRQGV